MNKGLISLFIIITGISILFFIKERDIYSDEVKKMNVENPADRILIVHDEIFGKLERPGVVFDHGKHSKAFQKEGCKTCHPVTEGRYLFFEYPFKITRKNKESIMNSFHEKCIQCHQRRISQNKKAGPIICGECHRREFASLIIRYPVFEFDFFYHETHVKNLKNDCSLCHHIYNEELVYEKGTEQSCYYCHNDQKKRGPTLAEEARLTGEKGLSIKNVSHSRCLNCHIDFGRRNLKAGPLYCTKCHTGKYRTIDELININRPERNQPDRPFISTEEGKMKGVLFDHKFHEKNTKTCRACHHETLNACKVCHSLTGSPEGKWINLTGAYHDTFSEISCAGCHKIKKSEKNCAGCHHHLLDIDLQAKGPKKKVCRICHSDEEESHSPTKLISVSELYSKKLPEKVTIKILEKQYEESSFPHLRIVEKLVKISNESKLATYFHKNIRTICEGCHHETPSEAESKNDSPPLCKSCHPLKFDSQNLNKPRLLAVYHRQCMGCHEKMDIKAKGCTDCHKVKSMKYMDIPGG